MAKVLLQPQEIEVFYLIPAIRKELAVFMKEKSRTQREIARLFGLTEAAVSQYFKDKRAREVKFSEEFKKEIEKSADMINNQLDFIQETQKLLRLARVRRITCKIHHEFSTQPLGCGDCSCLVR